MKRCNSDEPRSDVEPFTELFAGSAKTGWVAAQFWGTLLLVLAGLAWTRLPDKHAWQVLLSLLVPLLLVIAALALAGRHHARSGR